MIGPYLTEYIVFDHVHMLMDYYVMKGDRGLYSHTKLFLI